MEQVYASALLCIETECVPNMLVRSETLTPFNFPRKYVIDIGGCCSYRTSSSVPLCLLRLAHTVRSIALQIWELFNASLCCVTFSWHGSCAAHADFTCTIANAAQIVLIEGRRVVWQLLTRGVQGDQRWFVLLFICNFHAKYVAIRDDAVRAEERRRNGKCRNRYWLEAIYCGAECASVWQRRCLLLAFFDDSEKFAPNLCHRIQNESTGSNHRVRGHGGQRTWSLVSTHIAHHSTENVDKSTTTHTKGEPTFHSGPMHPNRNSIYHLSSDSYCASSTHFTDFDKPVASRTQYNRRRAKTKNKMFICRMPRRFCVKPEADPSMGMHAANKAVRCAHTNYNFRHRDSLQ